jgi:hypothetical protein
VSYEFINAAYLRALLESSALLKSGGGLSKPITIPSDFYAVVPFTVQLAVASEVFVEGEVYVDGELFVE